nr:hypothetical protein Iba_chr14cCG2330 [Ipomoea batatas]
MNFQTTLPCGGIANTNCNKYLVFNTTTLSEHNCSISHDYDPTIALWTMETRETHWLLISCLITFTTSASIRFVVKVPTGYLRKLYEDAPNTPEPLNILRDVYTDIPSGDYPLPVLIFFLPLLSLASLAPPHSWRKILSLASNVVGLQLGIASAGGHLSREHCGWTQQPPPSDPITRLCESRPAKRDIWVHIEGLCRKCSVICSEYQAFISDGWKMQTLSALMNINGFFNVGLLACLLGVMALRGKFRKLPFRGAVNMAKGFEACCRKDERVLRLWCQGIFLGLLRVSANSN